MSHIIEWLYISEKTHDVLLTIVFHLLITNLKLCYCIRFNVLLLMQYILRCVFLYLSLILSVVLYTVWFYIIKIDRKAEKKVHDFLSKIVILFLVLLFLSHFPLLRNSIWLMIYFPNVSSLHRAIWYRNQFREKMRIFNHVSEGDFFLKHNILCPWHFKLIIFAIISFYISFHYIADCMRYEIVIKLHLHISFYKIIIKIGKNKI